MKRILIACSLLAFVIALSIAALLLQHNATNKLLASCDDILRIYESGNIEECREAAQHLSQNLENDMRLFPFFLKHERMETLFQQAAALPHLISDNDPADFMSAISTIRMQLKILMDNEWPTPENIL